MYSLVYEFKFDILNELRQVTVLRAIGISVCLGYIYV